MEDQKKTEEKMNEEKLEQVKTDIQDSVDMGLVGEILKNNVYNFTHEDKKYRVRKPTFEEKQIANEVRLKNYVKYLRDDDYILQDSLIDIYKKKGIDIKKMDTDINNLALKKNDYMLKLGKQLKEGNSQTDLDVYKKEVEKLDIEIQEISIKKTNLLEFSIENQVMVDVYTVLTQLVSEKEVEEDKWEKIWATVDDLKRDNSVLVNKTTFYASLLTSSELDNSGD